MTPAPARSFVSKDSVEALTLGASGTWSLTDLPARRGRAFEHAGGRQAERRVAKQRASDMKRVLLLRSAAARDSHAVRASTVLAPQVAPLGSLLALDTVAEGSTGSGGSSGCGGAGGIGVSCGYRRRPLAEALPGNDEDGGGAECGGAEEREGGSAAGMSE